MADQETTRPFDAMRSMAQSVIDRAHGLTVVLRCDVSHLGPGEANARQATLERIDELLSRADELVGEVDADAHVANHTALSLVRVALRALNAESQALTPRALVATLSEIEEQLAETGRLVEEAVDA